MLKKIFCLMISVFICAASSGCQTKSKVQKFTEYSFDYFDTVTTVIGYETERSKFDSIYKEIKSLLSEYHSLYTIYNSYEKNNMYTINSSKNAPITVDRKIIDLLLFSKEMYGLTGGKTNIAMGSVLSIWHTYRQDGLNNPQNAKLPPMDKLRLAAEHTDINDVIIDRENNTVLLSDTEMKLDVGAVAKGYAVERIAQHLESKGVSGYLLNVGGNIRAVGKKPSNEDWTVGIENPDKNSEDDYLVYLGVSDMSVVTSGNYQRFYTVDGVNYHHLINPDTLMPSNDYSSVSVICDDSGVADALSTALFLMDYDDGIRLVKSVPTAEAMWVLSDGSIKQSDGFKKFITQSN